MSEPPPPESHAESPVDASELTAMRVAALAARPWEELAAALSAGEPLPEPDRGFYADARTQVLRLTASTALGEAERCIRNALEVLDGILTGHGPALADDLRRELRRLRVGLAEGMQAAAHTPLEAEAGERRWTFDRDHYRIRFPIRERPSFLLEGTPHEVTDCSERGLRFAFGDLPPPEIGTDLHGRIEFRRGETVDVAGVVVRIQGDEAALRLSGRGIPLGLLLREQLHLIAHYPMWEDRG